MGLWEHFREVTGMAPGLTPTPPTFSDEEVRESMKEHLAGTEQAYTADGWADRSAVDVTSLPLRVHFAPASRGEGINSP